MSDPLQQEVEPIDVIPVSSLERYSEPRSKKEKSKDKRDQIPSPLKKFPYEPRLNEKIVLWKGPIWRLDVDAIVNPTNESLSYTGGIAGDILANAGPGLAEEALTVDSCRTGQCRVTKGYNLPCKHIIHTVGPRFNGKYQTAAENALHNCYRSCLQSLYELRLRTIAFSVVNSQSKGYPPELGAHIALRTVRRHLEHFPDAVDTVVFCIGEGAVDLGVYKQLLPLYFPRSPEEQRQVAAQLPRDTGNEHGETVIEDRKIRIAAFPGSGVDSDDDEGPAAADSIQKSNGAADPHAAAPAHASNARRPSGESVEKLSPAMLATMSESPDEERLRRLAAQSPADQEAREREAHYYSLLKRAKEADLSDIARLNYVYQAGSDALGRPIVVLCGCRLPAKTVDLNRVFLYIIRILHPLLTQDFTMVYLHTKVASANDPPLAWLRSLYSLFDWKFGVRLRAFLVVHPTFFLKAFFALLTPFISSEFSSKIVYVDNLTELLGIFSRDMLQLPSDIYAEDQRLFGKKWLEPGHSGGL